jgi:hypothetical protein
MQLISAYSSSIVSPTGSTARIAAAGKDRSPQPRETDYALPQVLRENPGIPATDTELEK